MGEVQDKDIKNIFNKIIVENFQNLIKEVAFQLWKTFRPANRQEQEITLSCENTGKHLKI